MRDTFHVDRMLDGSVKITVTSPVMVVPPDIAVQMGRALFSMAGVETVLAEPGQTVIRPPRGNGNGIIR